MQTLKFGQRGLGTTLNVVSMILHQENPVTVITEPCALPLYNSIKHIFNIPDSRLKIKGSDSSSLDTCSDFSKIFSTYFKFDSLTLNNIKEVPNNSQNKPCIALGCYPDTVYDYKPSKNFPHNRVVDIETNGKIFSLLTDAGFNVINLDNIKISLEQKVYMLNNLCSAYIGYEGGLSHLSHVLDIPTFILPWRFSLTGLPIDQDSIVRMQLMHLHEKVYFLNDVNELLNWTSFEINQKIEQVNDNCHYKNPTYDSIGSLDVELTKLGTLPSIPNQYISMNDMLTKPEKSFIITNYKSFDLGGTKKLAIRPRVTDFLETLQDKTET